MRGENRNTRGKAFQNRGQNQQTQPTYDSLSGNHTLISMEVECSHLYANIALTFEDRIVFSSY